MHLNLEMMNMTFSSKVTNWETSFLGNNEEKEK